MIANSDRMLNVSMYENLGALRAGWKRIYIEVARRRPRRLVNWGFRVLMAGVVVPSLEVLTLVLGVMLLQREADVLAFVLAVVFAGGGLLFQLIALAWIYRMGRTPISGLLAFPLGSLIVGWIMLDGACDLLLGRPIRWGGREYILKPD